MASRHRNASPVTAGKDSPQPASAATSLRLVAEFPLDTPEAKESVTVTVRFRPLRLGPLLRRTWLQFVRDFVLILIP